MAKQKSTKQQQNAREAKEDRKFLMIVAVSTIVLVALLFFLFGPS
jgi:hypothetical protein